MSRRGSRSAAPVVAWALWDCGSTGLNAIVATFVFSVYLTSSVLTGLAIALTCAMFLIRDQPGYLWAGLVLLGATAACGDLASVPYNAMLRQLSTPQTVGRISGLGWASGYFGSVVLLLVIYTGFISGSGSGPGAVRGLLRVPVHDGLYVREAMLVA